MGNHDFHGWTRVRLIVLAWMVGLSVGGCGDYIAVQQPSSPLLLQSSLRPLPAHIAPQLVTNHWSVVEASHDGQALEFDGVPRFRVWFGWEGRLYFSSYCHLGAFQVDFLSENHYRLKLVPVPGITCTTPLDSDQFRTLYSALEATREYSFQHGWLWLTGERTRIALEIAETFPPFPNAEPRLMLNRWRWTNIHDRDGRVPLESLSPIYTSFWRDEIRVEIENCVLLHKLNTGIMREYLVQPVWDHGRCRANLSAQGVRALDALLATTQHELQENRLILSGESNVEIEMEIEGPLPFY